MNKFSIFIISHNRPNCDTYYKLRLMGYSGDIKIIIDDKDKCIDTYKHIFKDRVIVYNKDKVNVDLMDNQKEPKGIATYSREYCIELAKEMNLDYFLMLDDDLKDIKYRKGKSESHKISNLDAILDHCLDFMKYVDILCFGSGNDYIGGKNDDFKIGRGTNAYLIKVKSDIHFKGRYSEDRITPVLYSMMGKLIFKTTQLQFIFDVWQPKKKVLKGGCNDIYKNENNYMMMFYPVISSPGNTYSKYKQGKYVACTNYKYVCPKIISSRYKRK